MVQTMTLPEVHREPLNPLKAPILVYMLMDAGAAYNRYTPSLTVPLGKPWRQRMWLLSFAQGGARYSITETFQLSVQRIVGGPVTEVEATGDGTTMLFFDMPALTEPGWYSAVVTSPGGSKSITHFFRVGTEEVDALLPYWEDTFHTTHEHGFEHRWCMVPAASMRKAARLLKRRSATYFNHVPDLSELFIEDLVPNIGERGLFRKADGTLTTAHAMSYPFGMMIKKYPFGSQVDGPRGIGNLDFVAGCLIGRATRFADPASGPANINYAWSLHRWCRISPDGTITTLFGWRTPAGQLPGFGMDSSALEFVGDRSALPADKNHFARSWGAAWDLRTLGVSPGNEQTEGDGRESHDGNPVLYVTNGWTCDRATGIPDITQTAIEAVEFDGRSHATPPKLRRVIGGLHDVFGMDFDPVTGRLIVAERAAHRIIEVDPVAGEIVRVVVQGEALASVSDQNHSTMFSASTLERRRAAPCVAPEGLKVKGDYAYYCSKSMQCIKRINLRDPDAQPEHLFDTKQPRDFMLLDVSDGTFFPEGTLFWGGFEPWMHGYPKAVLKNPETGVYDREITLSDHLDMSVSTGRGPCWTGRIYTGGFAVGGGQMIAGASANGIKRITLANPDDPPLPTDRAAFIKGEKDLIGTMVYNETGTSFFGHGSPRGLVSREADYVLDYYEQFYADVEQPEEPPVEPEEPPVEPEQPEEPEEPQEPPVEPEKPTAIVLVVPEGATLSPGTYTLLANDE